MRILVVSDIHGNRAALDAIREPHDVCLCLGDLVEYGPEPAACIDWVRTHAHFTVRGNHDHGAAQNVDVVGVSGFRYLTMATRQGTVRMLSETDRRFLMDLPLTRMVTLGGLRFLLVHATPRDPLEEYVGPDPEAWATRLAGVRADFVLVGHTHYQWLAEVGKVMLLNPGTVGLPRDGNPRARYAVIEDGVATLKEVEYDIEATVAALDRSGFPPEAVRQLAAVYRDGKYTHADGDTHPTGRTGGGERNGQVGEGVSQVSATTSDPTPRPPPRPGEGVFKEITRLSS